MLNVVDEDAADLENVDLDLEFQRMIQEHFRSIREQEGAIENNGARDRRRRSNTSLLNTLITQY